MATKSRWAITWTGVVAAITLIAANGKQMLEVVVGTWAFLERLSETAPLGVWSFALALSLGVLSRPFLVKYFPALPRAKTRDFLIDVSALVIGLGVMYGQLRTLDGALLGLMAGFAAPLLAQGLAVLVGMKQK